MEARHCWRLILTLHQDDIQMPPPDAVKHVPFVPWVPLLVPHSVIAISYLPIFTSGSWTGSSPLGIPYTQHRTGYRVVRQCKFVLWMNVVGLLHIHLWYIYHIHYVKQKTELIARYILFCPANIVVEYYCWTVNNVIMYVSN